MELPEGPLTSKLIYMRNFISLTPILPPGTPDSAHRNKQASRQPHSHTEQPAATGHFVLWLLDARGRARVGGGVGGEGGAQKSEVLSILQSVLPHLDQRDYVNAFTSVSLRILLTGSRRSF